MSNKAVLQWAKQLPVFNSLGGTSFPTIANDTSGNTYVTNTTIGSVSGGTYIGFGGDDITVFKLDGSGNHLWNSQNPIFNTFDSDLYPKIKVDNNGNSYITYETFSTIQGGTKSSNISFGFRDIVVFKLNSSGIVQWTKQLPVFNTSGNNLNSEITLDTSGNVYITYETSGVVSGGTHLQLFSSLNIVVFKLDTNGNHEWNAQYPVFNTSGNFFNILPSITSDENNNVYVSYQSVNRISGGTSRGFTDIIVFKLNSSGIVQWTKQLPIFNTPDGDINSRITADSVGNVYISYLSGQTISGGTILGGYDVTIFKLDTNGNHLWNSQRQIFNTAVNDLTPDIKVDTSSNIYVSYSTTSQIGGGLNIGGSDIAVFKLNSSGLHQWSAQYPTFNTSGNDKNPRLSIDKQNNIFISYWTDSSTGATGAVSGGIYYGSGGNIIVFKLSEEPISPLPPIKESDMELNWLRQLPVFNTSGFDYFPINIATDSSNNIIVIYNTELSISGGTFSGGFGDMAVLKLDSSGTVIWTKELPAFNTIGNDGFTGFSTETCGLDIDSQDNIYVSYSTNSVTSGGSNSGSNDIVVFKLDKLSGEVIWIKQNNTFNSSGYEASSRMIIDYQDNILLAYTTSGSAISGGTNFGFRDVVITKMNSTSGNILWAKQVPIFNTSDSQFAPAITTDSVGNVYCAYEGFSSVSGGSNIGLSDIILFKLDSSGNHIWNLQSSLINSTNFDYSPNLICDSSDNIFLVYETRGIIYQGTQTSTVLTPRDVAIAKISKNGQILWTRQNSLFNTSGSNQILTGKIGIDTSNNLYFAYQSSGIVSGGTYAGGTSDIIVTKINSNGNHEWNLQHPSFNTSSGDRWPVLTLDTSNNICVAYITSGLASGGTFSGATDLVVFKLTKKEQPTPPEPEEFVYAKFRKNTNILTTLGRKLVQNIEIGDKVQYKNKCITTVVEIIPVMETIKITKKLLYTVNNQQKELELIKFKKVEYYWLKLKSIKEIKVNFSKITRKCNNKTFLANNHLFELIKKT